MSDITIRELNRQTKAVLARAKSGETMRITDSGRPVAQLGPVSDGPVAAPKAKRAKPVDTPQTCPDDPLGQLRWLLASQLRAVEVAEDERTRTQAAKEARALADRIGKLTGELREDTGGDVAKYERMQPAELLEAIEALAADLRKAIEDE